MSSTLINLIVQLIASAIGGNAASATMKNIDLGTLATPSRTHWAARAAARY
jgi:hypothetical protein